MFDYHYAELNAIFTHLLSANIAPETLEWLKEKSASQNVAQFNAAFVSMPRKTGKAVIVPSDFEIKEIDAARRNLSIEGWTADRFARVWLLMHKNAADRDRYFREIEMLFPSAEVNELVALYSALPVLAYPEMWTARCAEGIRNNIGDVLTAIMCNNPYPSENLNEAAWNQLVLKAFFTDKPVEQIIGLDNRNNAALASTLSDYAHERWAAHRSVNPQIWRCIAPFVDEKIFPDLVKLSASGNSTEREAAALACYHTPFQPAKKLAPEQLRQKIEAGELTWNLLALKTKDYVLQ